MVPMESSEIVKFFIRKGFQLDKHMLEFLVSNPNKVQEVTAKLESMERQPLVITLDLLKESGKGESNISVIRTFDGGQTPKTVKEALGYFQGRYQKISDILSSKVELANLISINKMSDKTKNFSVIALVKDKDESDSSITIEDFTGETKMFFPGNIDAFRQIVLDEVVGLVCENDNGINFVRGVVNPGVPLRKEAEHTSEDVFCYFISDVHFDAENFDERRYILLKEKFHSEQGKKIFFILGGISKKPEHIAKLIEDLPADAAKVLITSDEDVRIEQKNEEVHIVNDACVIGVGNVKIFASHGSFLEKYFLYLEKSPAENLLNMIQKRHLNPSFSLTKKIYVEDPYLLDIVPDIFAIGHFHKPSAINHKGITVLSTGSLNENPSFWKINLRTRENIKIDLV